MNNVLARWNNGQIEFWKIDGSQKLSFGPQDLFLLNIVNGSVLHVADIGILFTTPIFTISQGHSSNFCKVSIQTAPNTMFYVFLRTSLSTEAIWSTVLGNSGFPPPLGFTSMGPDGTSPGRGLNIGSEFTAPTTIFGASSSAGNWVLSDNNGFVDTEIGSNVKSSVFVSVVIPGFSMFNSRQIVSADYTP